MRAKALVWQERRETLLQRACTHVAEQVQTGVRIGKAIANSAARFANADLGNGHRLRLSNRSLQRIWYHYRKSGTAAFQLNHAGPHRSAVDPVLLRLVVEHCLQSGASVEEAVEAIQPPSAAKLTIKKLYQVIPKRALDVLARTHRALFKHRSKLEKAFLRTDAAFRRRLLKHRAELQSLILREDAALRRRLLCQREMLQRKFLAADAAAVKRREKLHREALRGLLQHSP